MYELKVIVETKKKDKQTRRKWFLPICNKLLANEISLGGRSFSLLSSHSATPIEEIDEDSLGSRSGCFCTSCCNSTYCENKTIVGIRDNEDERRESPKKKHTYFVFERMKEGTTLT